VVGAVREGNDRGPAECVGRVSYRETPLLSPSKKNILPPILRRKSTILSPRRVPYSAAVRYASLCASGERGEDGGDRQDDEERRRVQGVTGCRDADCGGGGDGRGIYGGREKRASLVAV